MGGDGELNLFDHFFADARNFRQLLGSHVRQFFDLVTPWASILSIVFGPTPCQFGERRARAP